MQITLQYLTWSGAGRTSFPLCKKHKYAYIGIIEALPFEAYTIGHKFPAIYD
jgi:hypothetical protein